MRRPLLTRVFAVVAAVAGLPGLPVTASGQDRVDSIPRFDIGTREELLTALGGADQWGQAFPRAAIVALEGRRVLPWLLDLLRDETGWEPTRWAALRVFELTRDRQAVPELLRLADSPDIISEQARSVLEVFPYPEVCEYWRVLVRAASPGPGDVVHGLQGLGWCGSERDLDLVGSFLTSPRQAYRVAAEVATNRIRSGARRYESEYTRGPPAADGSYFPTDSVAARIRRALCDGPCTSFLVPVTRPLRQQRRG